MTRYFLGRLGRLFWTLAIGAAVCVGITGCGGGEDAPKKIDVAAQVAALKGNTDAKLAALTELAAGGKNATPAVNDIIPLLKDDDAVVRRLAVYALGQIGPAAKAALPTIQGMLADPDRDLVTSAVNAIDLIAPGANPAPRIPNVGSK